MEDLLLFNRNFGVNTSGESYLEPERQGRGMVRRVPHPLAAKDIEKKSKFNGAKSGRKKKIFDLFFNILML